MISLHFESPKVGFGFRGFRLQVLQAASGLGARDLRFLKGLSTLAQRRVKLLSHSRTVPRGSICTTIMALGP